jgi:superfamily II DNA or RNA helicase
VKPSWLKLYRYDWDEEVWEEMRDVYGHQVMSRYGKPEVFKTTVHHTLATHKQVWTEDNSWTAIPRGDWGKLTPIFSHSKVIDLRQISPLGVTLCLKPEVLKDKRWRKGQTQAVSKYLEHGYGVVKGDTGSGKTVIGAGILCALGQRTLILTARKDGNVHWIEQIRKLTNIDEVEQQTGQKLIGAYNTQNKQRFFPITTATVQSLGSAKGRLDLPVYQDYFGLLLADEAHELVTDKYHRVIQAFSSAFLAGLTATPERTDYKHCLEFDLVGPIVAENKGRRNQPTVTFIHTGVCSPAYLESKPWHRGIKWNITMKELIKSTVRYDIIQKWLRLDLKKGRRIVVISPQRREIVQEIARRMRQDGYKVAYVDGTVKAPQRKQIYREVNEGKYDLLCAGKVMNALVDIQNLNTVYLVSPLAKHTPTKQLYGRARDQFSEIRDFADEGGQLAGAARKRMQLCQEHGWTVEHEYEGGIADGLSMRTRRQ